MSVLEIVRKVADLRAKTAQFRAAHATIGLVPTMGALHDGHLTLARSAKLDNVRVIATLFVNPKQFSPTEDLAAYPRDEAADAAALERVGVDLLFAPDVAEMYPENFSTSVAVSGLTQTLCGAVRPHFFGGVATVVTKLFNIVQPDVALFGQKDFQQVAVLQRVVRDLNFPIEIIGVPTVRDSDGLALSSRNGYLTAKERQHAPLLYQTLRYVAERVKNGDHDFAAIEIEASQRLADGGFEPDYVAIRSSVDLAPPEAHENDLIVLAAARLGKARLIDNLLIN